MEEKGHMSDSGHSCPCMQMAPFTIMIAFFIYSQNLERALPEINYLKGFIRYDHT